MTMTREEKNAIVKDLLALRPKGDGKKKLEFRDVEYFCYDACKHKNRVESNDPHWGYSPEILWSLNLRSSSCCRRYLEAVCYGDRVLSRGERGGLSRKTNRLWQRVQPAIDLIQSEGREGTYQIRKGNFGDRLGVVFANNHDHAQQLGEMFYGYLSDGEQRIRSRFIEMGSIDTVQAENQKMVDDHTASIEKLRSRIQSAKNEISKFENLIAAGQMLQMHTLDQMLADAE